MASTRQHQAQHTIAGDSAMAGVLALLVDERERRVKDDKAATKTEVLLSLAGLSVDEIVAVTGKTTGAVQKTLQRAKT